jgi:hypothetical protein
VSFVNVLTGHHGVHALATIGLLTAAGSVAAVPATAGARLPIAGANVCTPGTWVQDTVATAPSEQTGVLHAAAVASPTLAWAVGFYETGSTLESLIEKWTGGTSWSIVGSGGLNVDLVDVAALGPSSAFAVGNISTDTSNAQAVIERWNGTSWARTVLPRPTGATAAYLNVVTGSSSTDVWAVGEYLRNGAHPLLEHWDGSTWTSVSLPSSVKPNAEPVGAVSVGTNDLWIDAFPDSLSGARLWHYTGSWSIGPMPPSEDTMTGSSDHNLWMIGPYSSSTGTPLEHFDGSTWTAVDRTTNTNIALDDIALGASPSTVWTAGWSGITSSAMGTYIARNGAQVTAPHVNGSLEGIGTGSGLAFAVGSRNIGSGLGRPIVLAGCDT